MASGNEPKRDRWGRPMIKLPSDGSLQAYTRVTTLSKACDTEGGLTKWKMRLTVIGLMRRPDLQALASVADPNDKTTLSDIAEQAFEFAGASNRANLGTALHALTEQHDLGMPTDVLPALAADLAAYKAAMSDHGLRVNPKWIERFVVVDELQVAGTADRYVMCPDGKIRVFDIKTGTDLSYSWRSIAVQLGCYANGLCYDVATGARTPLPDNIDRDHGIVCHLPAGEGRCDMYYVDIKEGYTIGAPMSQLLMQWRKRKDMHRKIEPGELGSPSPEKAPAPAAHIDSAPDVGHVVEVSTDEATSQGAALLVQPPTAERREWISTRIQLIRDAGHVRELQMRWPTGVPGPKLADSWDTAQITEVAQLCDFVEKMRELPFGTVDPAQEPGSTGPTPAERRKAEQDEKESTKVKKKQPVKVSDGIRVTKVDVTTIVRKMAALPDDQRAWARTIAEQCAEAGTALSLSEPTKWRFCATRALLYWAEHTDTELMLAACNTVREQDDIDLWHAIVNATEQQLVDIGTIAQQLDFWQVDPSSTVMRLERTGQYLADQAVDALHAAIEGEVVA